MLLAATATAARPPVPADLWRLRVSDADIHDARDAWLRARHGGAPPERVRELREDLERLWRARELQGAEESTGRPAGARPTGE